MISPFVFHILHLRIWSKLISPNEPSWTERYWNQYVRQDFYQSQTDRHMLVSSPACYSTSICLSHAIPLPSVFYILYHSHLCITYYTTPICVLHAIPLPSVCHILYHSRLSLTCYTTPISLSHAIPLPSVFHMLCHSHLSFTCYTTPICLWHVIPPREDPG